LFLSTVYGTAFTRITKTWGRSKLGLFSSEKYGNRKEAVLVKSMLSTYENNEDATSSQAGGHSTPTS
jgi:hypothetical protein